MLTNRTWSSGFNEGSASLLTEAEEAAEWLLENLELQ